MNDEAFSLTTEEIEELRNEARKKIVSGRWVQRGVWLVNIDADPTISIYIGPDKMLVGVKDGKPVIKDKVVKS